MNEKYDATDDQPRSRPLLNVVDLSAVGGPAAPADRASGAPTPAAESGEGQQFLAGRAQARPAGDPPPPAHPRPRMWNAAEPPRATRDMAELNAPRVSQAGSPLPDPTATAEPMPPHPPRRPQLNPGSSAAASPWHAPAAAPGSGPPSPAADDHPTDAPAARPARPSPPRPYGRPGDDTPPPDDFTAERFLKPSAAPPPSGWRRAVWRASGGLVSPGLTPGEQRRNHQLARIQGRVASCQTIAFASGKGGVGKTTGTALCGTALSLHRGDRIVALDANPDAGSLGWRVRQETSATLTDLLRDADQVLRYSDMRAYTSQASSRLEVIASANDPAVSQGLGDEDYARAIDILERFYNVVLCDLGTGLLDSATQGIFRRADQVAVVSAPSLDAGRVASFTLDFIERRHPDKVRDGVVIINNVRKDSLVDVDLLERHFRKRVRAVVRIPHDRYLATGGQPEWDQLQTGTQEAYLELAAAIADGFEARAKRR